MTANPNTNTAARELLDRMREWGSENWSAASPALVREWADKLEATLTQQQGGVPITWDYHRANVVYAQAMVTA